MRFMQIINVSTEEEALKKAQEKLNELLSEHSFSSILLLVSGGSAAKILDGVARESLGLHVTVGALDERFSKNPGINNWSQLVGTEGIARVHERGGQTIDTRVIHAEETLEQFTERFEKEFHEWRAKNSEGVVIITQGIGPDGHTAGIMPYPEDETYFMSTFDAERIVAGYDAGKKNRYPLRVTVTLAFLRTWVDHSICFVVGDNKIDALARVRADDGSLAHTPGRIIREMKDVTLFTTDELFEKSSPLA